MSANYIPVATWHATVPVLDDGDAPCEATLAPTAEALADRDEFLATRVPVYRQAGTSDAATALVETTDNTFTGDDDYTLLNGDYPVTAGQDLVAALNFHATLTGGPDGCEFRLVYKIGAGGAKTAIPGSLVKFGSKDNQLVPVQCKGVVYALATSGDLYLYLQARITNSGTVHAYSPHCVDWETRNLDT